MSHYSGVVTGACANMHPAVAVSKPRRSDPFRVSRWLSVVEVAFGNDLHGAVDVEVDRIGTWRRNRTVHPSRDQPWSRSKEVLPGTVAKAASMQGFRT